MKYIQFFDTIRLQDIAQFGGKNASLGEMIHALGKQGVRIPSGFATTADAYREYLRNNNLLPAMKKEMAKLTDIHDLKTLHSIAQKIRKLIINGSFSKAFEEEVAQAYQKLSKIYDAKKPCDVAVRSSATAEDLPGASFAGQQETFLHVQGVADLLLACKKCMASLFTERAIVYRREQKIDDFDVAISVGVQKMVNSGGASSGVMFTLDTETGLESIVSINSGYGLGEFIVKGKINPDEFYVHKQMLMQGFAPIIKKHLGSKAHKLVYQRKNLVEKKVFRPDQQKFSLADAEILELARFGIIIENYYSEQNGYWTPMDIEWAKDSEDQKLYIVQARPETVHSKKEEGHKLVQYVFEQKPSHNAILITGQSVGNSIAAGKARIVEHISTIKSFEKGDILVTDMTDPDWVPIMKKAGAIVTNRGGRTCHAAIVSRELGIPAIIGTERATDVIREGQEITIDCSQGSEGFIYDGTFLFKRIVTNLEEIPKLSADVLVNLGNPDEAFRVSQLPVSGVGLVRLEFIISSMLKIHPMAVMHPEKIKDKKVLKNIEALAIGYNSVHDFFVEVLAQAIGMIAGAFYPRPVIVRLTDLKSNEYRELLGGSFFEPYEENPMLGFRGAVRYCSANYAPAFALECAALKKAREEMGFTNIRVMIPFVRTIQEAEEVVHILKKNGLERGKKGLALFMMVEIPSNVLLLEQFAPYFDGFSIGSNDLTQLTLGVDRDSGILGKLFDERDPAVRLMLKIALEKANTIKKYIGICGQAPSDFPSIAMFLIENGIDSISLSADSVIPFLMQWKK
jgi:pyruvate, water dikinase